MITVLKKKKKEDSGSWDEHELKNFEGALKCKSMAVPSGSSQENHSRSSLTMLFIIRTSCFIKELIDMIIICISIRNGY